ncbi:MAG: acyl transferase [Bacteroidia bacterium]
MSEIPINWSHKIFNSKLNNFEELCLQAFNYQFHSNKVYNQYCRLLGINEANDITDIQKIPHIPVELFKTLTIKTGEFESQKIFESSGTTGMLNSKHHVADLNIYKESFTSCFTQFFGEISNYCFLGLLPSYLEKNNSSLVYMVQQLMAISGNPQNGFFLFEHDVLFERIQSLEKNKQPYILFGVSFALLDFAEKFQFKMEYGRVIETGGMKGRKKEITKDELLSQLGNRFQSTKISSEYGMSELLSQAYSFENGQYQSPAWMKVQTTEINDPGKFCKTGKTGIIQVIDLANIHTCCFIKTSDIGIIHEDEKFEVLGRIDHSDMRGCSLLIS